jgi:hypothetical protein
MVVFGERKMIIKHIFLSIVLLLFLSLNLLAQNATTDLIKEVCPDAEIIWEKEFKGKPIRFIVAEKSGDLAFTLLTDDTTRVKQFKHFKIRDYKVMMFSKDGKITFDEWIDANIGIEFTEEGQIIPIIYNNEPCTTNLTNCIRSPVKRLPSTPFGPFLSFSPNFDYYLIDQDESFRPLEIFKSDDGTKLAIPNDIFTKGDKMARCSAKWIDKNELFVYISHYDHKGSYSSRDDHKVLYLFSFPEMKVKWQHECDKEELIKMYPDLDKRSSDESDKYIFAISEYHSPKYKSKIMRFRKNDGDIKSISCKNVDFIKVLHDYNLLLAMNNRYVYLFDFDGDIRMQCELKERLYSWRDAECIENGKLLKLIFNERIIYSGEKKSAVEADVLTLDVYYDYVRNDYYNVFGDKILRGNIKKYYDEEAKQTYLFAIDSVDGKCIITAARVQGKK